MYKLVDNVHQQLFMTEDFHTKYFKALLWDFRKETYNESNAEVVSLSLSLSFIYECSST